MIEFFVNFFAFSGVLVIFSSLIVAVTETPRDDNFIGKFYKIIEIFALNFGKAKMRQPNKDNRIFL